MVKGKLYTVIGIDGFTISRQKGLSVTIDDNSVNCSLKNVEQSIAQGVALDIDNFIDNGYSAIVECELVKGQPIATAVIAEGDEHDFDEFFEEMDEDDYDDDDE